MATLPLGRLFVSALAEICLLMQALAGSCLAADITTNAAPPRVERVTVLPLIKPKLNFQEAPLVIRAHVETL